MIRGGLGAHKWLDRRLLAELARSMALQPSEQLLIEDADGHVLETDRANLFAVIGGMLHTPPADGRLLPGVARDTVLRTARLQGLGVSVTPITRAGLKAASEVFVTNAVHGVQRIDEQIQQQMLKLNAIADDERKIVRQIPLERDPPSRDVAAEETKNLADDVIDVDSHRLRCRFFEERAHPPHHFPGVLPVANDPLRRFLCHRQIGRLRRQPTYAGMRICHDG